MSERIDYEAALIEHDDCAAFEGERGDCINLDDMKAIMDAALPDDDMYTVYELRRAAADLHLSGYLQQVLAEAVKVERGNP